MRWYGSTNDRPSESDGNDNDNNDDDKRAEFPGSQYLSSFTSPPPNRQSSLPRNESVGAGTAVTTESEPLLGERLLMGNETVDDDVYDDDDDGAMDETDDYFGDVAASGKRDGTKYSRHNKSPASFLSQADASTIDKVGSDDDESNNNAASGGTTNPTDNKRHSRHLSTKSSDQSDMSFPDPFIGTNVELDTLAYSRDPDESTLMTNDNFGSRNNMLPLEEKEEDDDDGKRRSAILGGLLGTGSLSSAAGEFPYYLICFGLVVGIGLCAVAAIGYVEYSKQRGVNILPGGDGGGVGASNASSISTGSSISGTSGSGASAVTSSGGGVWQGVPYPKISREAYGDPVSNFLDASLFHPSLLYQKEFVDNSGSSGSSSTTGTTTKGQSITNNDAETQSTNLDDNGRKLSSTSSMPSSPQPFLRVPFPTGAFWTNLVILPQNQQQKQQQSQQTQTQIPNPSNKNQYSYPIVAFPYSFQWSALGRLQISYSASRRVVQPNSIQDVFEPDMTFGSVEDIQTRQVVRFDSLSVTLRFRSGTVSGGNGGSSSSSSSSTSSSQGSGGVSSGYWETYIVQGSPYVTSRYYGLSPELRALSDFSNIECPPTMVQQKSQSSGHVRRNLQQQQNQDQRQTFFFSSSSSSSASSSSVTTDATSKKLGICEVSSDSTQHKKYITGFQFVVTTNEGLKWLVFTSEPITFEFDQAARRSIRSKDVFDGVIRVALVPPPPLSPNSSSSLAEGAKSMDMEHLASSSGVKRLIYHAGAYPVGGSVSWDFRSGVRVPMASTLKTTNKKHRKVVGVDGFEDNIMADEVPRVRGGTQSVHHQNDEQQQQQRSIAAKTAPIPRENNIGIVTFAFDTLPMTSSSPNSQVPLLMLSLPHHAASISTADDMLIRRGDFDLFYRSIKGQMVPVVGSTWSYEEDLTFTGFGDESLDLSPSLLNSASSSSSLTTTTTTTTGSNRHPNISESTAISVLDQSVRDLLLETAESDLNVNLPVLTAGAYAYGKGVARIAQLAHIVDVLDAANQQEKKDSLDDTKEKKNDNQTTPSSSSPTLPSESSSVPSTATVRRAYTLLEKYLTLWLVGDGGDTLLYDANLGGIVSKQGMQDIFADFGNGRYNDHHFHYGYVLYASAILGKKNPKFVSQYGSYVDSLFYDVAHNSSAISKHGDKGEVLFPFARHKSWFDGHSYATGLFEFANGKSQESSSEAVNCYYGAYLWSKVRWGGEASGSKSVDFARLLLATEMTGAKTYWHMTPPDDGNASGGLGKTVNSTSSADSEFTVDASSGTWKPPVPYNSIFQKNYMVGNLGMTDVTCTTWFGTENVYVHLINLMPITAITAELFDKGYVKEERTTLSKDSTAEKAWKGYLICNEAIIDPNNAWVEAQSLISSQLDAGISKSQVLYWVMTRDGFLSSTTTPTSQLSGGSSRSSGSTSASSVSNAQTSGASVPKKTSSPNCEDNSMCSEEMLEGMCCPTNEGVFLGCCD